MQPNPEMLRELREYPVLYVDDEPENLRIFELGFKRDFSEWHRHVVELRAKHALNYNRESSLVHVPAERRHRTRTFDCDVRAACQ
jgi:hypothetical protein